MANDFYKGDEDILYIKVNETYYPVACLVSNDFSENSGTIETTTRDNLGWKTFQPTNQSFEVSFEGIETQEDVINGLVTYKDLQNFKKTQTLIDFRIGSVKIIQGQGYIINISKNSPAGDLVSFSGLLQGFGSYDNYDPNLNDVFNYDLNFDL